MRSILFALLLVVTFAGASAAQVRTDDDRHPVRTRTDPDLGLAIIEGSATSEVLWLRGASRNIVRIDRRTGERTVVASNVVDMLADGRHLWALIALNDNESVVRDLRQADPVERRIYFEGSPIALFATTSGPGVLTTTMVLLPAGERWLRRRTAASLELYGHVSPLTGDALFVGYNKGEWGGGLRRVDVSTGTVSIVGTANEETCAGLLNLECDPVVGVVPDPERTDCVLVGVSLAHLGGRSGEVARVCGEIVTSVFADPLPIVPNSIVFRAGQTWPFDSLIATQDGWIAVGQDRFARSRSGVVTVEAIPPLRPWAGLQISEPKANVIFVEAACCWGSESFVQYRMIAIPVVS